MSKSHARLAKLGASLLLMGLIGCSAPAGQAVVPTEVPVATKAVAHWTYEGEEGPEHWGKLDPAYLLCIDGTAQTPIDITATSTNDVADPVFGYRAGVADFVNNGHTVQAVPAADNTLTVGVTVYTLKQLHFHTPSEHAIDGVKAAAEMHFVHQSEAGVLAVVGVMIVAGDTPNAAWESYVAGTSTPKGGAASATIDWPALLPAELITYQYEGSLTTPPCSEGVQWMVMRDAVTLSQTQIDALAAAYEGNARPIQLIGDRDVVLDTQTK
jgi:carbonic anhydrase